MTTDKEYMQRCLSLARQGEFHVRPNPMVGAVVVKDGRIIGEGWHARFGGPHAEIVALEQAGVNTKGADLYVSLEPCCFQGKTGPCTEAVIKAGIQKVFFGMYDPNPKVSGAGVKQLQAAGIIVEGPVLEDRARSLNPGFNKRMEQGLPWVRAKLATSLDGRTAMASGESKWITGEDARQDVQAWRARSDAILTGMGTIQYDDPSLNVRLELENIRQPLRVLVDSQLAISPDAKIFQQEGEVLVATTADEQAIEKVKEAFDGSNVSFISLPVVGDVVGGVVGGAAEKVVGKVDLKALLHYLATEKQCGDVLLESGAGLSGAMFQSGLVDEVITYVAPSMMGSSARPMANIQFESMLDKIELEFMDVAMIGKDCRMRSLVKKTH